MSHKAYDPGAAVLARRLAGSLGTTAHLGSVTRLLVDLNRSLTNRKSLFSAFARKLVPGEREQLLYDFYSPYREKVERAVAELINKKNPVLHISIHSFSPVKNGMARKADVGFLYDPARKSEEDACAFLVRFTKEHSPFLRVRRNYPYLGKADGFTAFFRRKYPARLYAGIEIEINQALLASKDKRYRQMTETLTRGIRQLLKHDDFSRIAII